MFERITAIMPAVSAPVSARRAPRRPRAQFRESVEGVTPYTIPKISVTTPTPMK